MKGVNEEAERVVVVLVAFYPRLKGGQRRIRRLFLLILFSHASHSLGLAEKEMKQDEGR